MDPSTALVKARAYCAKQERCRAELRLKLLAWEVEEEKTDALLAQLEKEGFLNEGRYAEHFAISKLRQNGWGRIKIRAALRQKQVEDDEITNAIGSIDTDEYHRTAQRIAGKRKDPDKVRKLMTGRGFERDVIDRVLRG